MFVTFLVTCAIGAMPMHKYIHGERCGSVVGSRMLYLGLKGCFFET